LRASSTKRALPATFARNGKLKLAARPAHYETLARAAERMRRDVDTDIELIDRARVRDEIDSDEFFGGLLQKRSAQMHMGKFGAGWRQPPSAAARASTRTRSPTGSSGSRRNGHAHRDPHGARRRRGEQVLVATGATRHGGYGSYGFWRRRIVPIGSFIVVTEPLGRERAQSVLSGRRTYTTTANLHHYFRLTQTTGSCSAGARASRCRARNRMRRAASCCRPALARTFPRFADARIDYCWGGLVDLTQGQAAACRRTERAVLFDGIQRTRRADVGPHGTVHGPRDGGRAVGQSVARPCLVRDSGPLRPPWFLPAIGLYYRLKDKLN
jgi:glycine/D-amino acid oxidase-like deaminating enzyme